MADVDAANERLNGLVTLLQAVGVGGGDMDRVAKSMGSGNLNMPDARQLNDSQVEDLIRKLQLAQAEAPQIIAALEAHAEARSISGGKSRAEEPQQQSQQEEDDDDDSDFDEDANYPMVGHGCSDDISVVSDLTTPTVVTGVPVPEEEHYKDSLPPMIVGGGPGQAPPMKIHSSKRRNHLNQVGRSAPPGGIAPPPRRNVPVPRAGGAAASRRKNYQDTMAKLHENPHAAGGPGGPPRKAPPRSGSGKGVAPKKRVPKPGPSKSASFEAPPRSASGGSWNAFESGTPSSRRMAGQRSTNVDSSGFLVGGDGFDPFSTGDDPFKSSAAGDLEFRPSRPVRDPFSSNNSADGFDAFGTGPNPARKMRPKRPDGSSGGPALRQAPTKLQQRQGSASQGRPRRARRASLAM